MHPAKALLFVATALWLSGAAMANSVPVRIDTGALQGSEEDGIRVFRGIPYAAPPVGDLRWRPPQQPSAWRGVRRATEYGHDCMQLPVSNEAAPPGRTTPSEDCLVLNVWTPAKASGARLPVMVWIHGGGFLNGGSSPAIYDGVHFARNGIVMVTFNYRLGRFGFFAHPALTRENPRGPLGNYAYMDMIAAFRWVHRNIAAFGGDPDNVTAFGESAGGSAIHMLLSSPAAKGLFAKAIIESGGGRDGTHLPVRARNAGSPSGESLGLAFARSNGIPGEDSQALAALRRLPASAVLGGLNIATRRSDPSIAATFAGPMVDGEIVQEIPQRAYEAGRQMRIPVLIGANSSDLAYPLPATLDQLFQPFGGDRPSAMAAYDPEKTGNVPEIAARMARDRGMLEPARFVARVLSAQGERVYEYRFSYVAESMRGSWAGAPHASEVPYVFDTVDARYGDKVTPKDQAMAGTISGCWIAFAKKGDPNSEGRPHWPAYRSAQDLLADFLDEGMKIEPDPWKRRLDLTEEARQSN